MKLRKNNVGDSDGNCDGDVERAGDGSNADAKVAKELELVVMRYSKIPMRRKQSLPNKFLSSWRSERNLRKRISWAILL